MKHTNHADDTFRPASPDPDQFTANPTGSRSSYPLGKAARINEFLLFCAGVNGEYLHEIAPHEYYKYTGQGAIVLMTSILAVFSGGYAVFTIFQNHLLAAFIGLFWGAIIFTLDRFFILSIKETDELRKKSLNAFPRLILAVFIGLLISVPLELRLFKPEIEKALKQSLEQENTLKISNSLPDTATEKRLMEDRDRIMRDLKAAEADRRNEIIGRYGVPGYGPKAIEFNIRVKEANQELQRISSELKKIEDDKKDARLRMETSFSSNYQSPDGFLIRIETLDRLRKDPDKAMVKKTTNWVSLLFILIEMAPILTKLFSPGGLYSAKVEGQEFRAIVGEKTHRVKLNREYRKQKTEDFVDQKQTQYEVHKTKLSFKTKANLDEVFYRELNKQTAQNANEAAAQLAEKLAEAFGKAVAESLSGESTDSSFSDRAVALSMAYD